MTTKKKPPEIVAAEAAGLTQPREYAVDKLVGIVKPTTITISKDDLTAISNGLDEIEQAAIGMFGLQSAILDLTMDKYTVVATYEGRDWSVNIGMNPDPDA